MDLDLNAQLRRARAELVAAHGNVYWDGWPLRAKMRGACVAPLRTARAAREWLSEVAALPGDEFDEFQRFVTITVRSVKPTSVVVDCQSDVGWQQLGVVVPRSPWHPWVRDVSRAAPSVPRA